MNFKRFFNTTLCEVTEESTLYWRGENDYERGDEVLPARKRGKKHWTEDRKTEQAMEYFRKTLYPNKPSRHDCVFLSVVPRSAYLGKGKLYEVKPRGDFHVTNSGQLAHVNRVAEQIGIRKLGRQSSQPQRVEVFNLDVFKKAVQDYKNDEYNDIPRQMMKLINEIEQYWDPVLRQTSKKQIEVLADYAVVKRPVDEDQDFEVGDRFRVDETFEFRYYKGGLDGRMLPDDEIKKLKALIRQSPNISILEEEKSSLQLRVDKGAEGTVKKVRFKKYYGPQGEDRLEGKYDKIGVEFDTIPERPVVIMRIEDLKPISQVLKKV